MAWKANIDKASIENRQLIVYATYFNDASGEKEPKIIPFPTVTVYVQIATKIKSDLDSLNNLDSVKTVVPIGPFVFPTVVLTPEEQARLDYSKDIRLFGQMNRAIESKAKKNTDQDYLDTQERLTTNFIDSYIDLF